MTTTITYLAEQATIMAGHVGQTVSMTAHASLPAMQPGVAVHPQTKLSH